MPRKRRIKSAKITFISLCARGANKLPVVFKADGHSEFRPLLKAAASFDERGELLACVYAPDHVDSQGDFADAEAIHKMQRESTRDGFNLDIHHDGKALPKDAVFVAENFLIAKGDERFSGWKDYNGNDVDLTGGWGLVLKVEDEGLRKKYRDGEWNGVSMFGQAEVETIKSDGEPNFERFMTEFSKRFSPNTSNTPDTEDDMKPEELKKAIEDNNGALATALVAALATAGIVKADAKPDGKDGDAKDDATPVVKFDGDPMNPEDVKKHRNKLAVAALQKGVDWSDPTSVAEYETKLADFQKSQKPDDDDKGKGKNSAEIDALKAKLAKLEGASAQDSGDSTPSTKTSDQNVIAKTETDAGKRIAKMLNARRGFVAAQ